MIHIYRKLIVALYFSLVPGTTIGLLLAGKPTWLILLPFAISTLVMFVILWQEGVIDSP